MITKNIDSTDNILFVDPINDLMPQDYSSLYMEDGQTQMCSTFGQIRRCSLPRYIVALIKSSFSPRQIIKDVFFFASNEHLQKHSTEC